MEKEITVTCDEIIARLEQLERQQRELSDRQAIQDCVTAFARGLDRLDVDLIREVFHPDAMDDHGIIVAGPAQLAEWAVDIHRREATGSLHFTGTHSCELDGDTAHAETYWLGTLKDNAGRFNFAAGRWLDRLERHDGQWKIMVRICVPEWAGRPQMESAPEISYELQAQSPQPARDRTDLSYDRPLAIDPSRVAAMARSCV